MKASAVADSLARTFAAPPGRFLVERPDGKGAWSAETWTPASIAEHVNGTQRMGFPFDPEGLTFAAFDLDGKKHPEGRAWSLAVALRIIRALADLGICALLEESRSGLGFHVWILFDANGPSLADARELAAALLRTLGLVDDFSEREGVPGFYPWPPKTKGCGRVPYLPLFGATNGHASGLLCDAETGEPFADQLGALEAAKRTPADVFAGALAMLLKVAPAPPKPERPKMEPRTFTGELSPYAEAALSAEVARVASAPDTTEHRTLYSAARNLGELVAGEELPRPLVESSLYEASAVLIAEGRGKEVEDTIRDGIEKGLTNPRRGEPTHKARPTEAAHVSREHIVETPPESWAEPIDFSEPLRPAFPVEVLPEWLGAFVESVALATQTPPDLAGCLCLAAASASIARRFEVHPRPDWRESANIYSATVLPPGHRKSAVFSLVQEPVIEAEREACAIAEPTVAEAEARYDHLAGRIKKLQGKAGDLSGVEADEALREIGRLRVELRAMRVPARPQYAVDDCTPERLTSLLAAQGERLAVFSAEGDLFEIIAGRYSSNGAPNLGVYLKAHSGDELRVDRVGRPAEYLHKPALTIGLAIQPDVLRTIQSKPGFRGRGLLGRFLYSLPLDALGSRDADPEAMPEDVRSTYSRLLRALWALPTRYDEHGEIIATPLTFSFPARDTIVGFLREIEPRLAGDGDLHPFTDWAGKLAGAVVRLAGVLHMADLAGKGDAPACEIQVATVERGIVLGRYFLNHAIVAFRAMRADETADDAGDVLAWLRKQARAGVSMFSKRDAHYARKHRFAKADDLDPALAFLESHGWIRPVIEPTTKRAAGRPSRRFEIHPLAAR